MANPVQSLNENFLYNSMLARALIQLIPANERDIIRVWLDKLHEIDDSGDTMTIRNEYMWFLLLQLQNKKITVPFNKIPPSAILRPLKDILPPQTYEEVLTSTEQNMSWLDQVVSDHGSKSSLTTKGAPPSSPPCLFLQNQPIPRNGIICYLAAFSDQNF